MTADEYLRSILNRERVDTSLTSPVRGVQALLTPVIKGWAGQQLSDISPSGSFAKGTANRSGTDIDLFVSLSSTTTNPLKELYESLAAALQKAGYPPRRQNVSLGIKVGDYDVDVVPAKRQASTGNDHSLYKRRADSWTKTNVAQHVALVGGSGRTDEIRIIKLWRKQKGIDFLSFYLELTVIEALRGKHTGNLATNVLTALEYLRDRFANARVVDPANSNNVISDDLTDAQKRAIAAAAKTAREAPSWSDIVR